MFHVNLIEIKDSKMLRDRINELKKAEIEFLKRENPKDYIIQSFLDLNLDDKGYDLVGMLLCEQSKFVPYMTIALLDSDTDTFNYDMYKNQKFQEVIKEILEKTRDTEVFIFGEQDEIYEYFDYDVECMMGCYLSNKVTGSINITNDYRIEYFESFTHGDKYFFTEFGCYRYEILYDYLINENPDLFRKIIYSLLGGIDNELIDYYELRRV